MNTEMHLKLTLWSLALYLLLLLLLGDHEIEASQGEKSNHIHNHNHNHESSTPPMDPSVLVFFTKNDLKLGSTMPIYFPENDPSNSPHFLYKEEADLIPFSSSHLPHLLQTFGFVKGSPWARAMEDTLSQCEMAPMKGETKICATSLESMLEFVREIFGSKTEFKALSTRKLVKKPIDIVQRYTIVEEPREVVAPKMVACHTRTYPYVIYYCHHHKSENKVFQVSLRGENEKNGRKNVVEMEAVAVCHMDTSDWSPDHVFFTMFGTKPGDPVCHFFPSDNLVYVPVIKTKGLE